MLCLLLLLLTSIGGTDLEYLLVQFVFVLWFHLSYLNLASPGGGSDFDREICWVRAYGERNAN